MVIASDSKNNVALRHSPRHLYPGGEPCNLYLSNVKNQHGHRVYCRVAPRLTETQVPGGGYPKSSDPEWTRVRSRIPGYLDPGYPGTRVPDVCTIHTLLIHWKENDERYATYTIPLPADADLLYHGRRDG